MTSLCVSDPFTAVIDELQLTLGEGPAFDAEQFGRPVWEPDLEALRNSRWHTFAWAALLAGVHGAAALPLQIGVVRIGALSLYLTPDRSLPEDRMEEAALVATLTTHTVLSMQAGAENEALAAGLRPLAEHRAVIDQASGIVAAQLGTGTREAFTMLQARAFATGQSLSETARAVVRGELRFE